MSSIDKRIVEMDFINDSFESNAKESMSTIDKLTEKLKFKNAVNGLEDINSVSNELTFDGAIAGVNTFSSKLSMLQMAAATALGNIAAEAVRTGASIAKSLTIDPVMMGFEEYETKIGAIQTILTNTASKGTTLADVTEALNELNIYADKTIYNFAEMTKNIGTFTAAGVGLEDAVTAIKGISNLAAGSGSTPQQAASAMYQLSQALAAGVVSLQDWNSVVNAGMGGELFQNALKETAKQMGIVVDESLSFRESISAKDGTGWLTADVLLKTLQKFANDESLTKAATQVKTLTGLFDTMKESVQSGWATTWEYIIGDFEEAPEVLTNLSNAFNDLIGPSTEARNAMFKFWNENGGREEVIAGLTNILSGLVNIVKAAASGFREMVPAMTGEKLVALSKNFRKLTEEFKVSDTVLRAVKAVFKALGSVVKIVGEAFELLGIILAPLTKGFTGLVDIVANLVGGFADLISNLVDGISELGIFDAIGTIFTNVYENIKKVSDFISEFFKMVKKGVSEMNFSDTFKPIVDAFGKVAEGFKDILSGVGEVVGGINIDTILKTINTVLLGEGLRNLRALINSIGDTSESVGGFSEAVGEMIGSITDTLSEMQNTLKAATLMQIAGAISILALSFVVLASIDEQGMENALVGITGIATTLTLSLMSLLKVLNTGNIGSLFLLGGAIKGIGWAMLILSGAMKALSTISWEGIGKGLVSILGLTATLSGSLMLLSGKKIGIGVSTSMIALSTSIVILTQAVEQLAKIDTAGVVKGVSAIGVLMTEMVIFMKLMDGVKMNLTSAVGIVVISGAINLMSLAIKQLGAIDTNSLIQGLSGLAVILSELVVFTKLIGNGSGVIQTAIGLTILGGAMLILNKSIETLGNMDVSQLVKGITGLAGALVAIGLGIKMVPNNTIMTALGLNLMALAMKGISDVVESMGGLSWDEIARGLTALGGSLIVLAGGLKLMGGTLMGSAALSVAALGLSLLVIQFKALSSLNIEQIGLGLLALAGILGTLGLAGMLLSPAIVPLLGLSTAMVALAGSAALMAGSLTLTGVGLGIIVAATMGIVEVLRQATTVVPKFIESIFTSINKITEGLSGLGTTLSENIGTIMDTFINTITDVSSYIPRLVEAGVTFVISFVEGIGSQVDRLIDAAVKMIVTLVEGITSNITSIVNAGVEIIVAFVNCLKDNLGMIIQAGIDLVISLINGMADGLRNNGPTLIAALKNLLSSLVEFGLVILRDAIGPFLKAGLELIKGLIQGIKDKMSDAKNAVKNVVDNAVKGASNLGKKLYSAGADLIRGFVNGIKSKVSSVIDSVTGVVNGAINKAKKLLGIHSPSRVFMGIGDFTVQGFSKGISKNASKATRAITAMTSDVIDTFRNSMDNIGDIGVDTNPVISPILDLTNVESGSATINRMLGSMNKLSMAGGLTANLGGSIKMNNSNTLGDLLKAINGLENSLSRPNNVTNYTIDGITYDDGSAMKNTMNDLIRIAKMERRR